MSDDRVLLEDSWYKRDQGTHWRYKRYRCKLFDWELWSIIFQSKILIQRK